MLLWLWFKDPDPIIVVFRYSSFSLLTVQTTLEGKRKSKITSSPILKHGLPENPVVGNDHQTTTPESIVLISVNLSGNTNSTEQDEIISIT